MYGPCNSRLPEGHELVVRDLRSVYDDLVVRQKDARETTEVRFGMSSVESLGIGESSSHHGVRFSNVIKWNSERESFSLCLCLLRRFPAQVMVQRALRKENEGRSLRLCSMLQLKRLFDFDDESVVLPLDRGFTSMI